MDLNILFLNDVHGYLESHCELFYKGQEKFLKNVGGYQRMAGYIQSVRDKNPNTLLFDGGDTFHGTLPLLESKGEALIPILKKMNIEAMVGHWDFAYGPKQLKKLMQQLNYPMLGINIYKKDGELFLPPYMIKEIAEIKIGIIGVCCPVIKGMPDHFSEGLEITDGSEELPKTIQQVKKEGADLIVLLSHSGFPQDAHLLSNVHGVDLCLSAHTHNRMYKPAKINDTLIINCGCHGMFMGHISLNIKNKRINDFEYQLVAMDDSVESDSEVSKLIDEVMKPYRKLQNEIVGHSEKILHRYDTLNSSMDELLLNSIRSKTDAEIAFCNGWRYGAPIQGDISVWDLYNMIPMNPPISTVELSGKEILEMLEKNLESTFSKNPMHQFGGYIKRTVGMSIKFRAENPKGNRIHEVYVGKNRLDLTKTYQVAFVTVQGVPENYGINRKDLKIKAVEAMKDYLLSNGYFDEKSKTFEMV